VYEVLHLPIRLAQVSKALGIAQKALPLLGELGQGEGGEVLDGEAGLPSCRRFACYLFGGWVVGRYG